MEIIGIGTDIVECPRIGRMVEHHGEAFLRRVYTGREIRHCQARQHAIEHFAAHWAAKEAVLKALGGSIRRAKAWTDVEIRVDPTGQPRVLVAGLARDAAVARGVGDIKLAMAHCRTYATAHALIVAARPSVGSGTAAG